MTVRPSGTQFEITAGENQVRIVEVGGGIRSFLAGGRPVLDGYDVDERCTGARGLPLIPWPNRLADGAYTFDGTDHQVPLTEPDKHPLSTASCGGAAGPPASTPPIGLSWAPCCTP